MNSTQAAGVATIDVEKSSPQLAELLSMTAQGTEVILARGEQILARLVPVASPAQRIGNLNPGSITTSDDFDEPLSDEFWLGEA